MRLNDISLLGWIHTFFYVIAMITGAMQMARRKGTRSHTRRGNVYFLSMLIANVLALFIFTGEDVIFRSGKPPVIGQGFGFFHWLAVIALALVLFGRVAASRQRQAFFAYAHPISMILSYWLLLGAAINQAFDRVDWVRRMALAVSPGARSIAGYKLLYVAYYVNDAVILAVLAVAVVQVRRFRRQVAGARGR
jgi:uncharacterized membrane protein